MCVGGEGDPGPWLEVLRLFARRTELFHQCALTKQLISSYVWLMFFTFRQKET